MNEPLVNVVGEFLTKIGNTALFAEKLIELVEELAMGVKDNWISELHSWRDYLSNEGFTLSYRKEDQLVVIRLDGDGTDYSITFSLLVTRSEQLFLHTAITKEGSEKDATHFEFLNEPTMSIKAEVVKVVSLDGSLVVEHEETKYSGKYSNYDLVKIKLNGLEWAFKFKKRIKRGGV